MENKKIKLNLGCGDRKMHGFINVDARDDVNPDVVADVTRIHHTFKDVDLIGCTTRELHNVVASEGYTRCLTTGAARDQRTKNVDRMNRLLSVVHTKISQIEHDARPEPLKR